MSIKLEIKGIGVFWQKKRFLFSNFKLKLNPMRKILTFIFATFITGSLFAGGLVTNNNQSAMFTRLQSRNASTTIDAVYFNPAGLTKMKDGFYASVNNQVIRQTRTITNNYGFLSGDKPREYIGDLQANFYPDVYVAFKTGKLAFSGGLIPAGGGGGAKYEKGLPSFEMRISDLVPGLAAQLTPVDNAIKAFTGTDPGFRNITGYSSDILFEGTSVYLGFQGNVSFEINDWLSVAAGARYVSAKDTYKGYIQGVEITAPEVYGGSQTPGDYLRTVYTLTGSNPAFGALLGAATFLDDATTVEADAELTGNGFTPILSVNITPMENLNIAVRYEFQTKLEMKTTVFDGKDAEGMFIQDSVAIKDMPASLSAGVEFKPMEKLMLSGSFNYYFDKNVDYDGQEDVQVNKIDDNFLEFGLGAEYGLTEKLRISAGWAATITGVNSNYQSDMTYSTNTNSFGGGLGFRITPMIDLNIGGQYTMYAEDTKSFNHMLGTIPVPVVETYNKKTWLIGVGLDFSF